MPPVGEGEFSGDCDFQNEDFFHNLLEEPGPGEPVPGDLHFAPTQTHAELAHDVVGSPIDAASSCNAPAKNSI